MNTPNLLELDRPPQPDSTRLLNDLINDAQHAQDGFDRFAAALQALAREEAHLASGKAFQHWALAEFDLPPALTEALLSHGADSGQNGGCK